jgi:hypothetical protein
VKTVKRVPVSQPCPTVSRTHPKLPIRDRVPVSPLIGHGHGTRGNAPRGHISIVRKRVPYLGNLSVTATQSPDAIEVDS